VGATDADEAPVETEIKLRMESPEAARQAVRSLGATLVRPRHLEDNTLFDDASHSLAADGKVLRLRRAEGHAILTFKGPRRDVEGIKARTELEVEVANGDRLEAILRALEMSPSFRYQKYRETNRWRDAEIVVDETPIGTFLEIEGPPATIHAAASALGRGLHDYIRDSYVALFFAAGGKGHMVFDRQ